MEVYSSPAFFLTFGYKKEDPQLSVVNVLTCESFVDKLVAESYVFTSAGPEATANGFEYHLIVLFPGQPLEKCERIVPDNLPNVVYSECTYFRHLECWFNKPTSDPLRMRPVATKNGFTEIDVHSFESTVRSFPEALRFFRTMKDRPIEDTPKASSPEKRSAQEDSAIECEKQASPKKRTAQEDRPAEEPPKASSPKKRTAQEDGRLEGEKQVSPKKRTKVVAVAETLAQFLSARLVKCTCSKKRKAAHEDGCPKTSIQTHTVLDGGTLNIPDGDRDRFVRLFDRYVWLPFVNRTPTNTVWFASKHVDLLVEKIQGDKPYRMYFELDMASVGPSHYTKAEMKRIAREFFQGVQPFLPAPMRKCIATYSCKPKYVVEGSALAQDKDADGSPKWKNGLHLHFPEAIVTKHMNRAIAEAVLEHLVAAFPARDWEEWVDLECWNTGLRIDGCRKAVRGKGGKVLYEKERYTPLVALGDPTLLDVAKRTVEPLLIAASGEQTLQEDLWDPTIVEAAKQKSANKGTTETQGKTLAVDDAAIPLLASSIRSCTNYSNPEFVAKSKRNGACYVFGPSSRQEACPMNGNVHVNHGFAVTVAVNGRLFFRCLSRRCKDHAPVELERLDLGDPSLGPHVEMGRNLVLTETFKAGSAPFKVHREPNSRYLPNPIPDGVVPGRTLRGWLVDHERVRFVNVPELPRLAGLVRAIHGAPVPARLSLAIKSPMDTKKTFRTREYMEECTKQFPRILYITSRQSMANDAFARFEGLGFVNYLDYAGPRRESDDRELSLRECDRAIVQIDSLHKLRNPFVGVPLPRFDLVVLDEVSSALRHACWPRMNNRKENLDIFQHYVKTAPRFVAMCADYGCMASEFLSTLRPDMTLVWNTAKPPTRKNVTSYPTLGAWMDRLIEHLKEGENVAVPTNSKEAGAALIKKITDDGILREDEILFACADSPDEIKDTMKTINDYIKGSEEASRPPCRLFVYTPFLSVGTDIHVDHFHSIFTFGTSNSNIWLEYVQGIGRIRKAEDIHVFIEDDRNPNGNNALTSDQLFHRILMNTDHFKDQPGCEFFRTVLDADGRYTIPEMVVNTEPMFRVAFHNRLDVNNSRAYFKSLVMESFENMGYRVTDVLIEDEAAVKKMEALEEEHMQIKRDIREEEILAIAAVEEPVRPDDSRMERGSALTAENKAWLLDYFYDDPTAHRDAEFVREWRDTSFVKKAEIVLTDRMDLERADSSNLEYDKTTAIGRPLDTNFKDAVDLLLKFCGFDGLFDQGRVTLPDKKMWNVYEKKEWIESILGIGKQKEIRGILNSVLKRHFNLKLQKKELSGSQKRKGVKTPSYRIGEEKQKALFQLLYRRNTANSLASPLENIMDRGQNIREWIPQGVNIRGPA